MITVFKKIWNFAGKEQTNIKSSILTGFLCAVCNAMQMGAVYYILLKVFGRGLSVKDVYIVSAILIISLIGKIAMQCMSQLGRSENSYWEQAEEGAYRFFQRIQS